jgi:Xaa-Pro dipeptidase
MAGFLSMGKDTFKVSLEQVFGANRKKLLSELRTTHPNGVVFLVGGTNPERNDSDHEPIFRQESYFWYLSGVKEPDCAVALDVASGQVVLFIPKFPPDYATIMGPIRTPDEWKDMYQVDQVKYMEEVEVTLEQLLTKHETGSNGNGNGNGNGNSNGHSAAVTLESKLLLMQGLNSDSGNMYKPPSLILNSSNKLFQSKLDTDVLFPILAECRVIKSAAELAVLQHVTEVTSFAHAYVMRNIKPNNMEYQGESLFRHYCYYNYGCRLVGYTPICGCGPNAAILHYGHAGEPNGRQLLDGDVCLFDMGAEYQGTMIPAE